MCIACELNKLLEHRDIAQDGKNAMVIEAVTVFIQLANDISTQARGMIERGTMGIESPLCKSIQELVNYVNNANINIIPLDTLPEANAPSNGSFH